MHESNRRDSPSKTSAPPKFVGEFWPHELLAFIHHPLSMLRQLSGQGTSFRCNPTTGQIENSFGHHCLTPWARSSSLGCLTAHPPKQAHSG